MAAVTGGVDLPDDSSKSEKVPHGKWESTVLKTIDHDRLAYDECGGQLKVI